MYRRNFHVSHHSQLLRPPPAPPEAGIDARLVPDCLRGVADATALPTAVHTHAHDLATDNLEDAFRHARDARDHGAAGAEADVGRAAEGRLAQHAVLRVREHHLLAQVGQGMLALCVVEERDGHACRSDGRWVGDEGVRESQNG